MWSELKKGRKEKITLFLRGGTGVGKTTIAKSLAKKLSPSVHIEQDILRYMIVNGLVASRTGLHPGTYPEEYRKQCKLADKNSLDLVRNFTDTGFITILDGFNGGESGDTFYYLENPNEIKWYPDKELLRKKLPDVKIHQVVLDIKEDILRRRLKKVKKWDKEVIDFILKQRKIFLKALSMTKVDLIVDTSNISVNTLVEHIINKLKLNKYTIHK